MARRLLDVALAALGLLLTAPLLALAALGIRWSSPGPVLYTGVRVGRGGRPFRIFKLRTMHAAPAAPAAPAGGDRTAGPAVTGSADPRVFPWGAWLRRTKIDELPQLLNVLRGDMTIIGPRPEDPKLVAEHYAAVHHETLAVAPGLASPGSLFSTTHGEAWLSPEDPERDYVERLLPLKLALDVVYVRRASLAYDLAIIGRTLAVLAGRALGRTSFPDPPELPEARALATGGPTTKEEGRAA